VARRWRRGGTWRTGYYAITKRKKWEIQVDVGWVLVKGKVEKPDDKFVVEKGEAGENQYEEKSRIRGGYG